MQLKIIVGHLKYLCLILELCNGEIMKILIENVFNGINYSIIFSTTLNDYRKI